VVCCPQSTSPKEKEGNPSEYQMDSQNEGVEGVAGLLQLSDSTVMPLTNNCILLAAVCRTHCQSCSRTALEPVWLLYPTRT